MSAEFPTNEAAPQETKEQKRARLQAELAALEVPEEPAQAPEAQAEAPVETVQEQAAETAAAPDPAAAERATADASALAATRERLGMAPAENAEQPKEDPLAGLTAQDYKNRFKFLKKGVDFPDLGAHGSNETVQGKTVAEWLKMTQDHSEEQDRLRNALWDRVLDGTATADQEQGLVDYLVDHYAIVGGSNNLGNSNFNFGPRWQELKGNSKFAEILERAKKESLVPGRAPA